VIAEKLLDTFRLCLKAYYPKFELSDTVFIPRISSSFPLAIVVVRPLLSYSRVGFLFFSTFFLVASNPLRDSWILTT
jgi:hypothetical protein